MARCGTSLRRRRRSIVADGVTDIGTEGVTDVVTDVAEGASGAVVADGEGLDDEGTSGVRGVVILTSWVAGLHVG